MKECKESIYIENGLDCISKMTTLPELDVDDCVSFVNVCGAVLPSFGSGKTKFNGLEGPKGVYVTSGVGG